MSVLDPPHHTTPLQDTNIMHKVTRNNDDATLEPVTTIHLVLDIRLKDVPTDNQIDDAMTAIYPTLDGVCAIVTQVIQRKE